MNLLTFGEICWFLSLFCHRITEPFSLKGTSWDHLAQPCFSSSVTDSKLTISSCLWNVSTDHRLCDFSGQPVSVFNHTHSKKKSVFLCLGGIQSWFFFFFFSCFLTCTCYFLSCQWAILWKAHLLPLRSLTPGIYTLWWDYPESSHLQAEQPQLCKPLLLWKVLQSLNYLCGHAVRMLWESISCLIKVEICNTHCSLFTHQASNIIVDGYCVR